MKYKYVSENHLEKMEDIIINNALPLVIRGKSRNEIERDIISLITKGLLKLRNSGQENKKIYIGTGDGSLFLFAPSKTFYL